MISAGKKRKTGKVDGEYQGGGAILEFGQERTH